MTDLASRPSTGAPRPEPPGGAGPVRRIAPAVVGLLMLLALVLPVDGPLTPAAFLRIPVEALVATVLLLVLPGRARTVLARIFGALLGLLTLLGVLHLGFHAVLDRRFDPV